MSPLCDQLIHDRERTQVGPLPAGEHLTLTRLEVLEPRDAGPVVQREGGGLVDVVEQAGAQKHEEPRGAEWGGGFPSIVSAHDATDLPVGAPHDPNRSTP